MFIRTSREGKRFAFILRQARLVIEQLELRRRTRHEHVNDRLRLRLKMRGSGHIRTLRRSISRFRQQRSQRDLARADGAIVEEVSAGDVGGVHGCAKFECEMVLGILQVS